MRVHWSSSGFWRSVSSRRTLSVRGGGHGCGGQGRVAAGYARLGVLGFGGGTFAAQVGDKLRVGGDIQPEAAQLHTKLVSHGRYVAFQMAEVAVTRRLFAEILRLIAELRPPPDPSPA